MEGNGKRPIGVMIYSGAYLLVSALQLPNVFKALMACGYSITNISAPATNDPSGFDIFLLSLIGLGVSGIPTLVTVIIGIGLWKFSNTIRLVMFCANVLLSIFIAWFLFDTWKNPWRLSSEPSLMFKGAVVGALILFISSLYYFSRPKVKAQFK